MNKGFVPTTNGDPTTENVERLIFTIPFVSSTEYANVLVLSITVLNGVPPEEIGEPTMVNVERLILKTPKLGFDTYANVLVVSTTIDKGRLPKGIVVTTANVPRSIF